MSHHRRPTRVWDLLASTIGSTREEDERIFVVRSNSKTEFGNSTFDFAIDDGNENGMFYTMKGLKIKMILW